MRDTDRDARCSSTSSLLGGTSDNSWLAWAAIASAFTGATILLSLGSFIQSFFLTTDDYALVFHSAAEYLEPGGWIRWFTEGYSLYFANYPDWPPYGADFSRPLMNLVIWAQSFVVPHLGEAAYLAANYGALVVSTALFTLMLKEYALSPQIAAIAGVALGLSPVWHEAVFWPSFGTNSLALAFSLGALVALKPSAGIPRARRLAVCVVLQILAIASHEAAAVVPLVCVALLLALAPELPPLRQLWPFLIPLALLLLQRSLLQSDSAVYPLLADSNALVLNLKRFIAGPLIPYDAWRLWAPTPARTVSGLLGGAVAALANAVVACTLTLLLVREKRRSGSGRRVFGLLAALGFTLLPGLMGNAEPRFMGPTLTLTVAIVLFLLRDRRAACWAFVVLVLVVQFPLFYHGVLKPRGQWSRDAVYSRQFFEYLSDSIREHDPNTVVLVNDRSGLFGAKAMLGMAAWPPTTDDMQLTVLNNLEGGSDPGAHLALEASSGDVVIVNRIGATQKVRFWGARPDFSRPNNGFAYEPLSGAIEFDGFVARAPLEAGSTLLLGVDPADLSFIEPAEYRP